MLVGCSPTATVSILPTDTPVTATAPVVSISPTHAPATTTTTAISITATGTPVTATLTSAVIPAFVHIYLIVMENKDYTNIIGNAQAPYMNNLVAQFGLAANYTAVAHPSEPNYLALFSGSTQGVTDDGVYNLSGQNLADQIDAVGKTWRVYAENVPTNCFTGVIASNGADGDGTYARKHNPAISFTNISRSPTRCANITDLAHFDPAVANYAFVVPNLCHDMHDCSVAEGDKFLAGFVPKILNSSAWQADSVLFITWDEGTDNIGGGGHVPLIVISSRVQKGFRSDIAHNHYSLVRTIEEAWGFHCLNESCAANDFAEFFR